jgi:hypothetical protein
MLASLRTTSNLDDWFESESDIRPAVRYAQNKVFFVTSDESKKHYSKLASVFRDQSSSDLLHSFIRETSWAFAPTELETDFTLDKDSPSGTSLSTMEKLELLKPLIESRENAVQVSETFENAFRRKFHPYLPFAREVTLSDPYAGHDIIRFGAERPKFLSSLLSSGAFHFELHTSVMQNSAPTPSEGRRIAEAARSLIEEIRGPHYSYSIYVYRFNSKKFHNRRLGIGFKNGGIGYMLDNSVGNLSSERFQEVNDMTMTDFKNFKMHLQGVRQGLQLLYELKSSQGEE